jgi:hypothetical protein
MHENPAMTSEIRNAHKDVNQVESYSVMEHVVLTGLGLHHSNADEIHAMILNKVYLGPFLALGRHIARFWEVYFVLRAVVSPRDHRLGAMGIEMSIDLRIEMEEIVA